MKLSAGILFGLALSGISDTPHRDMSDVLAGFLKMTEQVQSDAETMRAMCLGPRVDRTPYRRGI